MTDLERLERKIDMTHELLVEMLAIMNRMNKLHVEFLNDTGKFLKDFIARVEQIDGESHDP